MKSTKIAILAMILMASCSVGYSSHLHTVRYEVASADPVSLKYRVPDSREMASQTVNTPWVLDSFVMVSEPSIRVLLDITALSPSAVTVSIFIDGQLETTQTSTPGTTLYIQAWARY